MITSILKEQTKLLHEQAERAVDLPRRLVSVDAYATLLTRLHGFYSPLELQIEAIAGDQQSNLDLPQRQKAHLIREDLKALNWPHAIGEIPDCPVLPELASWPAALGCLYVLEGATLGGQFIRREVATRLGRDVSSGCAFFGGYGELTGPQWHTFCKVLCDYSDLHPTDEAAIVASAAETFRCFGGWVKC